MASATDIANRALQKLGAGSIMSITDPGKNATQCAMAYATLRSEVLRRHPWSFAMARASLAADDTAPAWGYDVSYTLPADCIRLVEIDGMGEADLSDYRGSAPPRYRIEGDRVLTDESGPLNIRYVKDVTDTGAFDPMFVEVLACRLAAELAEPLTQSLPKKQMALAELRDALREARRVNAIEGPPGYVPDDSWIMGRL